VEQLRKENIEPCLFWYNHNIHPYTEYKNRFITLNIFADNNNLNLHSIDEYNLQIFLKEIYPKKEERCKNCYKIRLEKTASFASKEGFTAFSTSLFISPYQDHEEIKRIGEELAALYNIDFYYKDFRLYFNESQQIARSKEMYMQKYCGCIFSEEERYAKNI